MTWNQKWKERKMVVCLKFTSISVSSCVSPAITQTDKEDLWTYCAQHNAAKQQLKKRKAVLKQF